MEVESLQALIKVFTENSSNEVKLGMLLEKVTQLLSVHQATLAEKAELAQRLADALANDAADQETIAIAQAAAAEAQARADAAQAALDADIAEDAQMEAAIDAVLAPPAV